VSVYHPEAIFKFKVYLGITFLRSPCIAPSVCVLGVSSLSFQIPKTIGNKKITKVIRTFTMKDGTTEVMEEIDEEYV
jgi:hypothetical protein